MNTNYVKLNIIHEIINKIINYEHVYNVGLIRLEVGKEVFPDLTRRS